jgi:hypothetical protein
MNNQENQQGQAHGHEKELTIIVNGRQKSVSQKELSFDEVVTLAFGPPNYDTNVYTVTYQKGDGHKPKGTLVRGETVKVKDGMIFDVIRTDKS